MTRRDFSVTWDDNLDLSHLDDHNIDRLSHREKRDSLTHVENAMEDVEHQIHGLKVCFNASKFDTTKCIGFYLCSFKTKPQHWIPP